MNDQKKKCLRVFDVPNWCYEFISKEHSKHSRHRVVPVQYCNVFNEIMDSNLVYYHSPDISSQNCNQVCDVCSDMKIPLIGAYAGNPLHWKPSVQKTYRHCDLIIAISPQTYNFAKENYPDKPVIFMPEPVDTDYFKFIEHFGDLTAGWAGGVHKPVKRSYLLDMLSNPVLKKSDWGNFTVGEEQKGMVEFYSKIGVLVVTSISECMPRVILEAMSCGLPVISTDVGSVKFLLEPQWIVPVEPENLTVSMMDDRINMLKKDERLRISTGVRNRMHVEKYFSWKANISLWDDVFEATINRDMNKVMSLADGYLKRMVF